MGMPAFLVKMLHRFHKDAVEQDFCVRLNDNPQNKQTVANRKLTAAVQAFRQVTDALGAIAVSGFCGDRDSICEKRGALGGILNGKQKLFVNGIEQNVDVASGRIQKQLCVVGIVQSILQNGTEQKFIFF